MPAAVLSPDELDDLIYYARTGDLAALESTITSLSTSNSTPPHQIVAAATDDDGDDEHSASSSGCCLLHWPAANGNEDVLLYLLSLLKPERGETKARKRDRQGLLNYKNRSGNTPLHWAAVNGHLSCVKVLMDAGADPTITNAAGHDALFEADCSGKDGGREVAEWMLANCEGVEKGMGGEGGGADGAAGMGGDEMEEDGVVETGNGT